MQGSHRCGPPRRRLPSPILLHAHMADPVNTDAIQAGLKAVKLIRCSVRDLFKLLSEGTNVVNNLQSENGSAAVLQNSNVEAKEKQFVADLQAIITNLNTRIRELESCTLLAHSSANMSLGNSALLGQDPTFERSLIYSSMITSYRWCDKMLEYSNLAHNLLHKNSLKRSHFNSLTNQSLAVGRTRFGAPLMYPLRTVERKFTVQQVDSFFHLLQRMFQDLNIEVVRPFGSAAVVKIGLERVLKAVILLRGLTIEWVMIKGYHEEFQVESKNYIDLWSESRYEVFRKVTSHANSAMLHFYYPVNPELAVKSFITWLNSYSSLFSKPCRKCESRLHDNLPPTWRDNRTLEAYHELCRP